MTHTVALSNPHSRLRAHALIDRAPPSYVCKVEAPRRTGEQNDKLWAMLTDVSLSKPQGRKHTPEMWKCIFMQACGHEVQFLHGLDGLPFPAGFRSSRMTKAQMSELIEFISAWGAENGVRWSEQA
jgi:hypothetical protein